MSFKLIAIHPLDNCNPKFLKNLIPNKIYKFYNDYDFFDSNNKKITCTNNFVEVTKIEYNPTVPENLYNQGDTNVNISAIVGKNGSGKSSLVELIYVAFYNLSIQAKLINDIPINEESNKQLENQISYLEKAIKDIKDKYEKEVNEKEVNEKEVNEKEFFYYNYLKLKKDLENNIQKEVIKREIIKDIKLNIYISQKNDDSSEEKILILNFDNNITVFDNNIDEVFENKSKMIIDENFPVQDLFYNIVTNYSFYGLNSNELGNWIENIFHKNDGYETPIVLNPMRTEGNININTENSLTKQRFLYNLITNNNLLEINKNKKIKHIVLKLKDFHINDANYISINLPEESNYYTLELFEKYFLKFFYKYNIKDIDIINNNLNLHLIKYILDKLVKITETYEIYNDYKITYTHNIEINYSFKNNYEEFFNKLNDDDSHITFKLKQALNFLFFNNLKNKKIENKIYNEFLNISEKEFAINDISYAINSKDKLKRFYQLTKSNQDIFHLPPSIFEFDYKLEDGSYFSDFSSGEKQFIYSINSILYHLINLNSKHENDTLYKYKYLNLILDEIELYSHPEMQKQFINNLLSGIKKLTLTNIQGINIIFITHSPFILSDIPKQNVLFLDSGKPKDFSNKNTFGANITDLLVDSFFFSEENGNKILMGDFAKKKIEEVINYLNNIESYFNHKKEAKEIIKLIDEPLLRNKLNEMYFDKFPKDDDLEKEHIRKRAIELGIINE